MRRRIFILLAALFTPAGLFAAGPYFQHKAPEVQEEFRKVYEDIRNVPGSAASSSSGKILQVIYGGSTTNFSTTQTTYQTSNLSADITPSTTTSRVKISFSGTMYNGAATHDAFATIYRGTAALGPAGGFCYHFLNTVSGITPCAAVYVDSPATTSAVTYSIRIKSEAGGTANFGTSQQQSIILEEVGP